MIFRDVRLLNGPAEVVSGAPFGLVVLLRAYQSDSYGIIEDVDKNEEHVTVNISYNNRIIYGASVPLIKIQDQDPRIWSNVATFGFDEIEQFIGQALAESHDNYDLSFDLILSGYEAVNIAGGDQLRKWFQETVPLEWHSNILVPNITAQVSYANIAKIGDPWTVDVTFGFPYLPYDVETWHGLIKLRCTGEDNVVREKTIYLQDKSVGTAYPWNKYYPNYFERQRSATFDIAEIVGPMSSPSRVFGIDVFLRYESEGPIKYTAMDWVRNDETAIDLSVTVVNAPPNPQFLIDEFINPKPTVYEEEVFPLKIVIENYGSAGTCYIECGGVELWRGTVGEYAKAFWQDDIVYSDLVGIMDNDNFYTMLFSCGYLDKDGNKVETPQSVELVTYVIPSASGIRLVINDTEGGRTLPAEGIHYYTEGQVITVKAIPDTDYIFNSWRGDVDPLDATKDTITLIMDSNKIITPIFTYVGSESEGSNIWPYLTIASAAGVALLVAKGGRK